MVFKDRFQCICVDEMQQSELQGIVLMALWENVAYTKLQLPLRKLLQFTLGMGDGSHAHMRKACFFIIGVQKFMAVVFLIVLQH